MSRLSLFRSTVFTCAITLAIQSCSAKVILTSTPTVVPTLTLTLTQTATNTPTPIPPTSTPGPPAELNKDDYKSKIEELTDNQLKEQWQRLKVAFPSAEIYMTERGEVCVFNSKGVLLCGQVLRGSSGSTFTYLITSTVSWECRIYLQEIVSDNTQALNTIFIPDMVNNAKKDEIIRMLETLLDLNERIITAKEDLANYQSVQPRHLIAAFAIMEEETSIINTFAKDVFHNYEGYENYAKNPNLPTVTEPFWTLYNSDDKGNILLINKFSHIVKAEDGTFLYTHFESGQKDFPGSRAGTLEQLIAAQILVNIFDQLIRDYLDFRGELNPGMYTNPRSYTKFEHLFDNYPPLSIKYWEVALADGNFSDEEQATSEYYTTDTIKVSADSFMQVP